MTENKLTIRQYMDGFIESDHKSILDCLTNDIVWYKEMRPISELIEPR